MAPFEQLFCVCLIAFFAIEELVAENVGQPRPFVLRDHSFSIRSSISSLHSSKKRPLNVDEYYSIGQRRAKLKFGLINFFYDARTDATVRFFPESRVCFEETLGSLYSNYLFGEQAQAIIKVLNAAGRGQDLKYIIGPAKFLFLFAHETDKLKKIDPENEGPDFIRNHEVVKYSLEVQVDFKEMATIFVYYDKATYSRESAYLEIPLQIVIETANDHVMIDYFGYQLLDDEVRSDTVEGLNLDSNSEVILDLFTWPTSINCTNEIKRLNPISLFDEYSFGSSRLSFRAETVWPMKSVQHFVAFDGLTQFMRVDTRRKNSIVNMLRDTTRVFDFRNNRLYRSLRDRSNGTTQLSLDNKFDQHCVVTYISPPSETLRRQYLHLADLLFGTNKFVPMGRAKVRGVEARVFEGFSTRLPHWMSDYFLFKTAKGQYMERTPGSRVSETYKGEVVPKQKYEFSVVVYLAAEEPLEDADFVSGPRVLLVEVYDLRLPKTTRQLHRTVLTVWTHSFVWDLSDSPSGDDARSLFTLTDRCMSERDKNGKYVEVGLIMEEEGWNDEGASLKEQSHPLDWIKKWWLRDAALAAGVSDVLGVQATMMYELESRFREKPTRSVEVSFRVSEHPQLLYETVFVGRADITGKVKSFFVQSAADCLWSIDTSEPVTYLLYSELAKACIIDPDLRGPNADPKKSKLFSPRTDGSSELFRVEVKRDREVGWSSTWLRDSKFQRLENRVMVLQNVQAITSHRPDSVDDIKMRIKHARMQNFNYMSSSGFDESDQQVRPTSLVLAGFGFHQGSLHIRRALDSQGEPIQSLLRCQAACLTDVDCRSFSFCARHPDPHCTLSEVRLDSPNTRKLIEEQTHRLAGHKFKVKGSDGSEVELVRDFRCELRNKDYLGLFKPSWIVKLYISALRVIPVKSVDLCAQICMGKSLELIRSGMNLAGQINDLLQVGAKELSEEDSARLESLRKKHRDSMEGFCHYFMYLDSTLNEEKQRVLMEMTNAHEPTEYCILERDESVKSDSSKEGEQLFELGTYRFDFTNLYERVSSLRLIDSEKTNEENEAYRAVSESLPSADGRHYELLRKALSEGKNFQVKVNGDSNRCAHLCFAQTSGLWPACRSFDVAIRSTGYFTSVCTLNTESLRSSNSEHFSRTIGQEESNFERVWHYEPIFGLVSRQLEINYELDYLEGPKRRAASPISGFLVAAIAALGLVSGLVFGLYSARWLDGVFVEGRGSNDGLSSGLVLHLVADNELNIDTQNADQNQPEQEQQPQE